MKALLNNDWQTVLSHEFEKTYFAQLSDLLETEYKEGEVFPPREDIFNAFNYTTYKGVKVVILGQDPYHDVNQAHGLCFSVQKGIKIPPSLRNIYKELNNDLGCEIPTHGNLEKWAKQDILMINAVLTVKAHEAASHAKIGWHSFTDAVISIMNDRFEPVIFVLWGNFAKSKKKLITNDRHIIIESAHPSPLAARRGFFGSEPFTKINEALITLNKTPIDWQIEE